MALSRVVSEIFNVEKCCDREIGVRSHSRSLKVVPFGRSCMVSYSWSLETLSLKRTVFEIFDFKNEKRNPGQENYTIQSGTHDFLLTFHSNHRLISHRFRDKRRFPSKIARKSQIFPTPVYISPPLKGFPLELCIVQVSEETRMMGFQTVEKVLR